MGLSITKRIEWDAGHRLLKHGGKCQNLHGHRYAADITIVPSSHAGTKRDHKGVDEVGVVLDFSTAKRVVGGWVDDKWDHGYVAQEGDPFGTLADELGMKVYWMRNAPSAENLAEELYHATKVLLEPHFVRISRIELFETPTCSAVWEPDLSKRP